MDNKRKILGSLLLLLTAVIWGAAFVSQSKGMESMGPLTFQGVRCLIGAVAMIPLGIGTAWSVRKKRRQADALRQYIRAGLLIGLVFSTACTLQQYGIGMTTVGKAGFITALYIVLVPVFGLIFLKKKPVPAVWIAVGIALAGFYLLCLAGEGFSVSAGDMLVLAAAAVFAVHILVIDHFVASLSPILLSWMQLIVCGVLVTALALIVEHPTLPQIIEGAPSLLYAGVMSSALAYTLQMVGQKWVSPTAATLIMSLESVVAALSGFAAWKFGILSTDQGMTWIQVAGCVLVFAAVVLVQLPRKEKKAA